MLILLVVVFLLVILFLFLINRKSYRKNVKAKTYKLIRNIGIVALIIILVCFGYLIRQNNRDGQGDGNGYSTASLSPSGSSMSVEEKNSLLTVVIRSNDIKVNGEICASDAEAYSIIQGHIDEVEIYQLIDDYAAETTYANMKKFILDLGVDKNRIEEIKEQ